MPHDLDPDFTNFAISSLRADVLAAVAIRDSFDALSPEWLDAHEEVLYAQEGLLIELALMEHR